MVRLRPIVAASMLWLADCAPPAEEPPAAEQASSKEPRPAGAPAATMAAASKAASPGTLTTISVTITAEKLFVRGRAVEPLRLQAQLEALAERSPSATIAVQADATVPKERMNELVKTIKAAGFSTVEVATRPVP